MTVSWVSTMASHYSQAEVGGAVSRSCLPYCSYGYICILWLIKTVDPYHDAQR